MPPKRMTDQSKEDVMSIMRTEFMPRETLNITFEHIQGKLEKIEDNLKTLPRDLAIEFEARFGDRIKNLEKEVDELKAFKWKVAGIMIAVQTAIAFVLERWFGH